MAEVWTPGRDNTTKVGGKVGTQSADWFPFLDMELSWSIEGTIKFGVHLKPNQWLKYLNAGSAYTLQAASKQSRPESATN
jgi:hypothetical protein